MSKIKGFIKKKHIIFISVIVIAALAILFFSTRGSSVNFQSASATVGNVIERVSVTGAVSPVGKANLAFEKSGVISRISVAVGDPVVGEPGADASAAHREQVPAI